MRTENKIYIAGHQGLVGSALVRNLANDGYFNLIYSNSNEMDLRDQNSVEEFFAQEKPEYVFLAAARVGGIQANNTYPAEFIYDNLMIQTNVIHFAYKYGVKKLLFLGSSCIYPRLSPQPMKEEYLLSGQLEPTNESYAVAKIAGIKMCSAYNRQYNTDFICVMPTNLYGPNDNFALESSHVLPALIKKFHEGKIKGFTEIEVWGTGTPRREFLYADDLAEACVFLMKNYHHSQIGEFVNIGTGKELTIKELAFVVKEVVGYQGNVFFNPNKPDGAPQKLLDLSRINNLGWQAATLLKEGIEKTYKWYMKNHSI